MALRSPLSTDNLVLGTVNAPWKRYIDAVTLAEKIATGEIEEWLCHLATFFGEVNPQLIFEFAENHAIPRQALKTTYKAVKARTGESCPALEAPDRH